VAKLTSFIERKKKITKKLHTNLKIVHFGMLMAWIERVAAIADDPTHRKLFWRTLT